METLRSKDKVSKAGGRGRVALVLAAATLAACSSSHSKAERTPPPSSTLVAAPPSEVRTPQYQQGTAYVCEGIYTQATEHGRARVIARPILSPRGYPMDVETSSRGVDVELPSKVSSEPTSWYNLNGVAMHKEDQISCSERQVFARQIVQPNGHRTWVASTTQGEPLHRALDIEATIKLGVVNLDYGQLDNVELGQVLDRATAIAREGQ